MTALIRFLILFLWCSATLALEVPFLSGRVTDNAEVLSAGAKERITAALKAHEEATSNQIAVLTVPSLDGSTVEDYANQVFSSWKLGQKGKDNGVLLLIAPKDRRLRIEVGYGLEGTLPDVTASRIIRNVITPRFKAKDYDGGVEQGVNAIIGALKGEALAADNKSGGASSENEEFFKAPDMPITERILIGAFIFGIIGLFTVLGVLTPGMGWFIYFFLIPFWAMFPIVVIGGQATLWVLGTYLIGFPAAKLYFRRQPWYAKAAQELKAKGRANVGGWVISSGGGSSGGFSSSSSGGFSGGGGSSGGGGASGSW